MWKLIVLWQNSTVLYKSVPVDGLSKYVDTYQTLDYYPVSSRVRRSVYGSSSPIELKFAFHNRWLIYSDGVTCFLPFNLWNLRYRIAASLIYLMLECSCHLSTDFAYFLNFWLLVSWFVLLKSFSLVFKSAISKLLISFKLSVLNEIFAGLFN